jgi:hypothetical protein
MTVGFIKLAVAIRMIAAAMRIGYDERLTAGKFVCESL